MKWTFSIQKMRDEVLRHLPVFWLGVVFGAVLAAMPLALANPQPEPPLPNYSAAMLAQQPEKNCDELWEKPYSDLTAAEREARYECDEEEAIWQRDLERAELREYGY
ncbi:hypothetical protein [Wielerella bovis]|uniref:hypothetical protein n=1 Tax=Wielerella bovis TaxID=2917790 RepID=UPI002019873B|nr:hypothetical protein [Wielerella bovis]MCG7655909.1 hypothetical protein [Wielerella bovis]MCG7656893.1 hypothetical protein [Wielerella bovis]MCG7658098.1 hypothetical protein [Wielerella bovis]MCG7658174.1 hypothetical protein [Wielerella bovis]MCG7659116.1 hypothetical protein [Wielerella bovis]